MWAKFEILNKHEPCFSFGAFGSSQLVPVPVLEMMRLYVSYMYLCKYMIKGSLGI